MWTQTIYYYLSSLIHLTPFPSNIGWLLFCFLLTYGILLKSRFSLTEKFHLSERILHLKKSNIILVDHPQQAGYTNCISCRPLIALILVYCFVCYVQLWFKSLAEVPFGQWISTLDHCPLCTCDLNDLYYGCPTTSKLSD